jgi:putative transposase
MKKSRFTEKHVVNILPEADKGDKTIGDTCRAHGVSQATFYNWRK